MDITEFLPGEEVLVLAIRRLFEGQGYQKYRMGTLEEYDLYADNKSFLKSESIITFHDARGRLMALKPDVTLSIVKNSRGLPGGERLYYLESVYRLQSEGEYREIPQMGLECIGSADRYTTLEVLSLALRSLEAAGRAYILELSHMGLVEGLMECFGISGKLLTPALEAFSKKSEGELYAIGAAAGLEECAARKLSFLARQSGRIGGVLDSLEEYASGSEKVREAIRELRALDADLAHIGLADHVRLDLSTVNSIDYYNGIIFRGYLDGVPRAVLAGGRYDKLMSRFGKPTEALGFALYLDELNRVFQRAGEFDVDALIVYGAAVSATEVYALARKLISDGKRVTVRPTAPEGLRCREIIRLGFEEESHA